MSPRQQDWPCREPSERENPHSYHRSPGTEYPTGWGPRLEKLKWEVTEAMRSGTWLILSAVVVPALLVGIDPIVFDGIGFSSEGGILGFARTFAFFAMFVGALFAVLSLTINRMRAFQSGVLAAAGVFAGLLWLALLPFSLIGIMFLGLGLLGMAPAVTSLSLLIHAEHAMRESKESYKVPRFLTGFLLYIVFCAAMQSWGDNAEKKSSEELRCGAPACVESATARLKWWGPFIGYDDLVWCWFREKDKGRKARLAAAYLSLTGGDIERDSWRYID
jgi:hypothetical protein